MSTAAALVRGLPVAQGRWLEPLHDWPGTLYRSLQANAAVARIVVASVRGSAPRAAGTCMIVEGARTFGTIGGGHLEWQAIEAARTLLQRSDSPAAAIHQFVLGADLAQCCGGVVEIWVERYTRADLPFVTDVMRAAQSGTSILNSQIHGDRVLRRLLRLADPSPVTPTRVERGSAQLTERLGQKLPSIWLYGAGHVGQALVRVLAELPVRVCWIDSRTALLPVSSSDRLDVLCEDDPVATVARAPADANFIVMTHSHVLDYDLCKAILERGESGWLGLIGSKSKAARFRSHLAADGLPPATIARLTSPIGMEGIDNKFPGAIAVSVAAQLLRRFEDSHERRLGDAASATLGCDGDCRSCASKVT